ncbi:acyltransferase family protein [Mycolicibacterium rufum]|uniref:Acyltransferase family protein n=1 Tax=Mycolicibacterium rufum TaxID=318424 RepID=A0A9X3BRS5_9MYCO|nr:lysophospholipid acyltransferase family protein [Mycolicibacterium rufum]KGI70484.1 glycerol acyltransferase [Mycolicibacterium rufum]MCV7071696.1 acyltransferase family protein [Mycolicibacterium rufum]ULP36821.1 acyltransferase family protein [Mycolicibacterium rufum]
MNTTVVPETARVRALRRALEYTADRVGPLVDATRPYVDGLEHLPRDGRFLLVGNHTQAGVESFLVPYVVRRAVGVLVRPLVDRQMGRMRGLSGDLLAAAGGVVGSPEAARELMSRDEPVLVFPGGAREISKFKGEQNTLLWEGRAGFARVAIEHSYPIVPAALLGGDEIYRSLVARDSVWGRLTGAVSRRLTGRTDTAMPLLQGIGPTMIPRPQRMYLRLCAPIETAAPEGVAAQEWVATVKRRTQQALEHALADLGELRATDPYRRLDPRARSVALEPAR